MGVYQGDITLRDATYTSVASIIAAFNKLEEAILGCGMVRATSDEDSGQAGTWVSGTPGSGETQVVNGASGSSGHMTSQGYKTFKLPDSLSSTNPILVRCYFCVTGSTTVNQLALATFAVKIGTSGWSPSPSDKVPGLYIIAQWGSTTLNTSYLPIGSKAIVAACGEGYFWLAVEGAGYSAGTQTGSKDYPTTSSIGVVGVAVLRPRIADEYQAEGLLVLAPALVSTGSGGYNLYNTTSSSPYRAYGVQAFKYSEAAWAEAPAAPFPPVADLLVSTRGGNTRVGVGQMMFNSQLYEVDAAIVNYGSVTTNGTMVDVDLRSTGIVQCRASHAFCEAAQYQAWQTSDTYKYTRGVLALPWEPTP